MAEIVAFARALKERDDRIDTRIYVICSESGHVKVGVSDSPLRRLAALQTANPFRLWLGHETNAWPRRDAFAIERAIHIKLAERFPQRGEWFSCGREDALRAILAVGRELGPLRPGPDPGDVI